ncbi:MAG: MFS transporter [Pirellulaceae bacterium]|jgi:MFS family permease|nr:MFS transporter [Pirellulaceae bacterium]HJN13653.1 MFS transporter [Pirellulaceae bacterium]
MPALELKPQRVYGRVFWLAYLANALTMIAWSILVRYADFVTYLGGAEGQLGMIVGVGMVGSLVMRFGQGIGIDRLGARTIWLWSLVFLVLSLLAHCLIHSATSPAIFLARILMQTSVAGIFGASITYISRRVPPARMAEIVGTLGTSGFIGILVGPQVADWICSGDTIQRGQLNQLFLTAGCLVSVAFVAAWGATRGQAIKPVRRSPNLFLLMRRYHPGVVMLVAAAVGAGVSVPNTFLRTYAAEIQISQIGTFFATYAITAFAVRMLTRRQFERRGNRVWVMWGLAALVCSMLLYLTVRTTWQLMIPGSMAGVAHALLFPSVLASGSTAFPERYRGLGTTLMLGMFDTGALLGAPAVGGILHFAHRFGFPAYPMMFCGVAFAITSIAIVFWFRTKATVPFRSSPRRRKRVSNVPSQTAVACAESDTAIPADYCEAID